MTRATSAGYDLAVIGAGPAGMAAASEARSLGLSVLLVDEQPAPGGQIYRAIESVPEARAELLGPDYASGAGIAQGFRASGAEYRPGALVWNIEAAPEIGEAAQRLFISTEAGTVTATARQLIVATGAIERPMPVPGWTLPGVTTAGALQILLKAHGGVAEGLVLAGQGPLLFLIAWQMLRAGVAPKAIIETTPPGRELAAARHLAGALRGYRYLTKGLTMLRALKRAGVPIHRGAEALRIEGAEGAEAVSFRCGKHQHRIETAAVALHQGVVPNLQVARLLRCRLDWDAGQRCFRPALDADFRSSVPGVRFAGDGAGIGGAKAAALRGRLAALGAAEDLGQALPAGLRARLQAAHRADAAVRPFLETLYAPPPSVLEPADETLICRCEEITAGQIRAALRDGAPGPNQLKAFLRCGMGPCQGRTCGLAVTELVAAARGEAPRADDYFRIRPPLKPLTLGEMAEADAQASS